MRMEKIPLKTKVSIVYRARTHSTSSEEYLALSKCLISSSMMKSLRLKAGSMVLFEKSTGELFLSKCWPCKASQLGNEIVFLNKNWQAFFDTDEKKTVINSEKLNRLRVIDCSQLEVRSLTLDSSSSSASANTTTFLLTNLQDVLVQPKIRFSLPVVGTYHEFEVVRAFSKTSITTTPSDNTNNINATPNNIIFYRITSNTQISLIKDSLKEYAPESDYGGSSMDLFDKRFVGQSSLRSNLLQTLQNKLLSPLSMNNKIRGILIHGPPGVGKSQLVQDMIQHCNCNTVKIDHSLLLHSIEGEAEVSLRKSFLQAKITAPTIIHIDHFDLVCPQRSAATTTDLQKRIVTTFLTLMDEMGAEERVVVIACTSKILDVDAAAKRSGRMDMEVDIPIPNEADRDEILRYLLSSQGVQIIDDGSSANEGNGFAVKESTIKAISRNAHGMVGADLLQVLKESFFLLSSSYSPQLSSHSTPGSDNKEVEEVLLSSMQKLRLEDEKELSSPGRRELTEGIMETALKRVTPSSLREVTVEVPTVRWSDIGGMERVKQSLRQVIELPLKHPELFKQSGMTPLKGVLLYGPPGCSKTLMAKAVATETSMNFLAVRGPELLSKWLGDSEKAVQSLFRKARAAAPSIIFFDEIDALAGIRGDSSSGVSDRVLSQLLVELDGISSQKHVIVIAATNRPDMLDAALIRPGRIDRKIYVPPPDEASRKSIFELELSKLPHDPQAIDLDRLVLQSHGFSGAEVVSVVNDAVLYAIERSEEEISVECLEHALSKVKPQITATMLQFYERFDQSQLLKA